MKQQFAITALWMLTTTVLSVAALIGTSAAGEDAPVAGSFEGEVSLKALDDDPFVPSFRLIGDLRFRQSDGRVWLTPSNTILDGRSVPTLFVQLFGHPFEGSFPKTSISYEHAVKKKYSSWEESQRMFYEAAVTEGVAPAEARAMYTVLSASGSRWALRGPNSCFSRCHTDAKELEWRPRVDHDKLVALLDWVRAENPALDAVDRRASETIIEKGPHIFGNLD